MAANLSNLFGVRTDASTLVGASTWDPMAPFARNKYQAPAAVPYRPGYSPVKPSPVQWSDHFPQQNDFIPGVPTSSSPYDWAGVGTPPPAGKSDAEKRADAEAAKAKRAGKAQTAKENKNTQDIIDTLIRSIEGYRSGYKQQQKNADAIFKNTLGSLDSQYQQTIEDLASTQGLNEEDEGAKSFAAKSNFARERRSLQEQAALQGAGETDQLRAQVQALGNLDANLREVNTAYQDTRESVNSGRRQANITTETARNNAWGSREEARTKAAEDFYANYTQTWTDIQRTAASNTNIGSDYSTAFQANFRGKNPRTEASKNAGKTRVWQAPKKGWATTWSGKASTDLGRDVNTGPAMTMTGPQRAEGVTLQRW